MEHQTYGPAALYLEVLQCHSSKLGNKNTNEHKFDLRGLLQSRFQIMHQEIKHQISYFTSENNSQSNNHHENIWEVTAHFSLGKFSLFSQGKRPWDGII